MKTLGYIITNNAPLALCFPSDAPKGGILLQNKHVTLFASRGQAYRAIGRTLKWVRSWKFDGGGVEWANRRSYRVQKVTAAR